jgi:hypothetical protein
MPRKLAANPRTNVITLRVTPKVRFGLELLAHERSETLTQVVTWAVESMFGTEHIGLLRYAAGESRATRVLDRVWSPDEHERVVRLGVYFPELMSDRQTYLWTRVLENGRYWAGGKPPRKPALDKVNWPALAKDWAELTRAAEEA